MTQTPYVEQKAELRVYSGVNAEDFDPDALTSLLGITPTTVARRGEPLRSGGVRERAAWWWETGYRVGADSEAMVLQVLETFEPVAKQLTEAKLRWSVDLAVGLVVTMHGGPHVDPDWTPGLLFATRAMAFSAETLARLSVLGASLDADQYIDEIPSQ